MLPKGWRDRLVRVANPNTNGVTGLCLEVHDLSISKYIAGRQKDLEFTRELARHGMTTRETLLRRLAEANIQEALGKLVTARTHRDFNVGSPAGGARKRPSGSKK